MAHKDADDCTCRSAGGNCDRQDPYGSGLTIDRDCPKHGHSGGHVATPRIGPKGSNTETNPRS